MSLLYAVSAKDFIDKIDIALYVAPITRNFPLCGFGRAPFAQPKACQNFINGLWFDRDPHDSIAFFVTERNVRRISRNFAGGSNFLCRRSTCDLADQLRRAMRRT